MWLLVLGILATALGLLGVLLFRIRARAVPGVRVLQPFHPLIGNQIIAVRNLWRWPDFWNEQMRDCNGEPMQFCVLGSAPVVVIPPSEKWAAWVLGPERFDNFDKGPIQRDVFSDLLGNGIFQSSGELWFRQRKVASHAFSLRHLRDVMTPVFVRHGQTFCAILDGYVVPARDDTCGTRTVDTAPPSVDIHDLFFRFTLDAFAFLAFGEDLRSLETTSAFATAFDVVQNLSNQRFYDPLFRLKRMLNVGTERVIATNLREMDTLVARIIARKQAEHNARGDAQASAHTDESDKFVDLLGMYIDHAERAGETITSAELRDHVLNFIIAGRDTTACGLSWLVYEFSRSPEAEERAREEVLAHVGSDAPPDYESVKNLHWLHACFAETLRLHPSVPLDSKCLINDDVMPNGVRVPARTVIAYAPYLFGRSLELWGPDATEFRPDRWLDESGHFSEPSQYRFITFNAGPRICLGKNLAYLEAKLLAAMLLQRFVLTLEPGQDIRYQNTVTLPMANGMRVRVRRRVAD